MAKNGFLTSTAERIHGRIKPRKIRAYLLSNFILLLTLMALLVTMIFSLIQYQTLQQIVFQNLRQVSSSVDDSVTQQIRHLDTVTRSVIIYYDMQNTFDEYVASPGSESTRARLKRDLSSALQAFRGYDFSIRQLNMYSMEGEGFGVGDYTGELSVPASEQVWYQGTMEKKGGLHICAPLVDDFLTGESGVKQERRYFSLSRMYYNRLHVPDGFMEIKKYYDDVFYSAIEADSTYNPEIYVYDQEGNMLYPEATGEDELFDYYSNKEMAQGKVKNTVTGEVEYVACSGASEYGLTVVAAVSRSDFVAPIYRALMITALMALAVFGFCILVSSRLAQKISRPLTNIYRFLTNKTQNSFQEIDPESTGIVEIDKLYHSINENIRTQKMSAEKMLLLKEQEVQAQMLALQAQMNPHFLFNSLTTIAEMAEEGMKDEAVQMSKDITEILRYISSGKEQYTTLEEELEVCNLYLNCMNRRFQDQLHYSFDVEDDLLECSIPKLCIQMLVENSIKFSTDSLPPWEIHIQGRMTEEQWMITVRDNGPGFTTQVECRLRAKLEEIESTGQLPKLKIQGMGILNIYIRLYLLYNCPFVFEFGNMPEGGAFVTIGGPLHETD